MADKIINLRRARKDRARVAKAKAGNENAVRFGQTAAQRAADKADADKIKRHLDGHHRDTDEPKCEP
ncbi:MAG: DUF4169 family protein [Pseudomonadota bacterium]